MYGCLSVPHLDTTRLDVKHGKESSLKLRAHELCVSGLVSMCCCNSLRGGVGGGESHIHIHTYIHIYTYIYIYMYIYICIIYIYNI
jgi:hypothetical protein